MIRRLLTICADDFGVDVGSARVIVGLAAQGRLNALSCLVNAPAWERCAQVLAEAPEHTRCGLHFNLSEGLALSAELRRHWPRLPALPRLMVAARLGRLPLHAIAAEWQAQWDAFVQGARRTPDFVDGHQHVHQIAGVREIVVDAATRHAIAVRSTAPLAGPGFTAKRWLIECTGGRALRRLLLDRRVPHNAVLLGAYDFRRTDYGGLMQGWLARCPPRGALLFCHPGVAVPGDPIGAARAREASYLGSEAFTGHRARAGVSLDDAWLQTSNAD